MTNRIPSWSKSTSLIAGFKGGRINLRQITRQKHAYEPGTQKTINNSAGSAKTRVTAEFEATRQHQTRGEKK